MILAYLKAADRVLHVMYSRHRLALALFLLLSSEKREGSSTNDYSLHLHSFISKNDCTCGYSYTFCSHPIGDTFKPHAWLFHICFSRVAAVTVFVCGAGAVLTLLCPAVLFWELRCT